MNQSHRLPRGGRIDRSSSIEFEFNGLRYQGYKGDTLASALLANGISLVGRSFKYHRPRGIVGAGAEEPNAIVQLGVGSATIPNLRATQIELYQGLRADSVNCWPSVSFDVGAINSVFSRFLPAGFYYKTFMWPKSFWHRYETVIRKAAGFGRAPIDADPDHYDKTNAHCDVLVAGSGPAGIAAALAAARMGARVILADEQNEAGGSLLSSHADIDGLEASDWASRALAELAAMSEVRIMPRTTVAGYYDHNFITMLERVTDHLPPGATDAPRQRIWRLRARRVVIASGAIERPIVFGNNDRPGVMLASAVSTYVNRYGVAPGRRIVLFTNNDSAYQTALDLTSAGVEVAAIVDARPGANGALVNAARERGLTVMDGQAVVNVQGGKRVEGVQVMALSGDRAEGAATGIACDVLACSGGWSPAVHLHSQSGGRCRFDLDKASFVPEVAVQDEASAGACNGTYALADCLREGHDMGVQAATLCGFDDSAGDVPTAEASPEQALLPLWRVKMHKKPGRGPKQFVDYQNDTSAADIYLATREGFESIEHVKRYTALGFGTDQGKLGNINGMAILAEALGQSISATGTTTFRPPYTAVTFGALAGPDVGELFDPVRKTAMHSWHAAAGAEFENVGQWHRPWFYPEAGETMHDAVNRECAAVRESVGIMDASTLGKIDIQGPDAAEFLNRIYTNNWLKLGMNRARYGFMLKEDGMVMDDGVTVRIGENHYFMHTTTGGAANVMAWMELWLQTEWPELNVYLTSVTDHWATAAVVGPNSRKVLSKICEGIDFDGDAFPFMSSRTGKIDGIDARVNRISFSGELAYEVNVNANHGLHVWEALMAAGAEFDITPYGTESMHVLRAEKGFVIVGQDTDGSMTPQDLGMDWIVSKTKDFLGKRSLLREDCIREDRKQLVGLLTEDPTEVLPEGGQITNHPEAPIPVPMIGHVTSSYHSPAMGRSIAMAVVKGGHKRHGETVHLPLVDGRTIKAEITSPVFFDSEGARQNV